MYSVTAPQLGVVGAPDIAAALSSVGFSVITGDDFREAATAISLALKDGPFPVIVADTDYPVAGSWATVSVSKGAQLIVLDTQPGSGMLAEQPELHLPVPATFNDLLAKLGYAGAPAPLGTKVITLTGALVDESAAAAPAPLPAPEPEPEPEPVAEPVAEPTPAPVEQAQVAAGPVFGAPAAAPEPVFGSAPAVTPAADPAPAAPVFGAPTVDPIPTAVTPEPFTPAAAPAPVFGAPAPAPAPAPEPTPAFPVAPQAQQHTAAVDPAPAPAPAPTWDQMIHGHAPAPAPTPVATAEPVRQPFRGGAKRGEVIFSAAGKGGVGKTTSALLLAYIAAECGLQAVLIDANRGQADIRKYLRLGDSDLPSAYDAYSTGDPSKAILMPRDYAHLRTAAKLDVPDFGIVLGPPSDLAGSRYASAGIYGDMIDYARSIADLVIVDTQIMEAPDERTDLWRDTVIPMLGGDAWMLAITDESSAGVDNLHERLAELRRAGMNPARTLVLASKFLEFGSDEVDYFQKKFGDLGSFVGNTAIDDDFAVQMNLGKVPTDSPSIRPAIDNILLRATGRAELFSPREPARPAGRGKTGGVKFGGLFGKKKSA